MLTLLGLCNLNTGAMSFSGLTAPTAGFFRQVGCKLTIGRQSHGRGVMRSAIFARFVVKWAGAMIVLAAAVLSAPQKAHAACSHYVRSMAHSPLSEIGLELIGEARVMVEAVRPLPDENPARRLPCSGLLCSGQPGLPSVPAGVDLPRPGSWALLPASPQIGKPEPPCPPRDDADLRASTARPAIFHPPRCSGSLPGS